MMQPIALSVSGGYRGPWEREDPHPWEGGDGFLQEAVPGGWRTRRMHEGGRVEEMGRPLGLKAHIQIQL